MMVQFINETQESLTYQLPMSFSIEHVIYLKNPGHIQIVYITDETHLTHQKSDPDSPVI